jgi:hypothetical protein
MKMKGYFAVLESVDLGTDINPLVRVYHDIWNKINDSWTYNKSAWNPASDTERAILRGFKSNYDCPEMYLALCLDLNSVEVDDIYAVASDFREFAESQLKPYFDYAFPIFQAAHRVQRKKVS